MKNQTNLSIFVFLFLFSCNSNKSFRDAAEAIKSHNISTLKTVLNEATPSGVDGNGNSLYHLAVLHIVKPSFYELLGEKDVSNMTVKNAEGLDPMELALKNANNSGILGLLKLDSWEVSDDSVYIRKALEDDKVAYFVVQLNDAHLIARDESNDNVEIRLINSVNGQNISIEGLRMSTDKLPRMSFCTHLIPMMIQHPESNILSNIPC